MNLILLKVLLVTAVQGLNIFEYKTPLVSLKEGRGWIINGNFKLIHVINLTHFEYMLEKLTQVVNDNIKEQDRKLVIEFHLSQAYDRLKLLRNKPSRKTRSINWIGSAWKWIAGNPDATDWNQVLQTEKEIAANNDLQYKINNKLLETAQEMTQKLNAIIGRINNGIKDIISDKIQQDLLNEILVVKGEINEIVRACQMAKNGLINTNLLDKEEIGRLINEVETLPYSNEIEAIEYGTPSVFTNETMLLYILSMPKIRSEEFNLLRTRASIYDGKQIDLNFDKILINHKETYGIVSNCFSMNNMTVCRESSLKKIPEHDCVTRLLKGGPATCTYRSNSREVIELINGDTIFVTNFEGKIKSSNISRELKGTFIIQMQNETIHLNNQTFTSLATISLQALPPALVNITKREEKLDLGFVHNISLENIKRLGDLHENFKMSIVSETIIVLLIGSIVYYLWKRIHPNLTLPPIRISVNPTANEVQHPVPQTRSQHNQFPTSKVTQTSDVIANLRDVDI